MKLDAKLFSSRLSDIELGHIADAVIGEAKGGNMQAVLFLKKIFEEEDRKKDFDKAMEFFNKLDNLDDIEDINIAVDFDDEEETVTMSA